MRSGIARGPGPELGRHHAASPRHVLGQARLEGHGGCVANRRVRAADVRQTVPDVACPRLGVLDLDVDATALAYQLGEVTDRDARAARDVERARDAAADSGQVV